MTARPTSNLDWLGTQIEPSSGAKSLGYAPGDRPTAQNVNWIYGNTDEWVKFLNACFGDVLAQAGFTFTGDSDQFARALALRAESTAYLGARAGGSSSGIVSLAISEHRIVGAGASGAIKTSDDFGATWTSRTAAGSYSGDFDTAHFYNQSSFVIAGGDAEIQTSPDGGTWTRRNTGGTGITPIAIASRGTQIVVVGDHAGAGGANLYSNNGTSWTANPPLVGGIGGTIMYDVAASQSGAAVFVAVGYGGPADRTNYMHRSTNGGSSWSAANLTSVLASTEFVEQVVWHASLGFVALVKDSGTGEYACVITSEDGLTWTKKGASSLGAIGVADSASFVATTGGLMLIASSSSWQSLSSLDGDTWAQLPFTLSTFTGAVDCLRFAKLQGYNAYMLVWTNGSNVRVCGPWAL